MQVAARRTLGALAGALLVAGCADPAPVAEPTPSEPRPVDLLLEGTWHAAAVAEPEGVASLLDAPGGDGWVQLFYGDLPAAGRTFAAALTDPPGPEQASARLGLARVHLAHSEAAGVGASLHRQAAEAVLAWRAEHPEAVRAGAQDPLLRALVSPSRTPVEPGEVSGAARFAHQLIASRASGAAITEAPPTPIWAARLAFAASVEAGDLDAAERKLPAASQPDPDLIDLLGQDAETGVLFEMAFYDPAFLPALQRYHAGRAWHFAAQLGPAGQALQPVLEAAWGGPLPAAITEAALPAAELPAWAAVFLSTSPTPGDLRARFADRPGDRWASRAAAATGDSPSDVVDGELRAAAALEPSFSATLQSGAEGSLARDLQFGLLLSDALLRGRMAQMLATGNAPQALRLARRSADLNPGSLGGAANSAATRVSHRNDRAFLLRLAGCLWSAGQPGQALDFAHPLAQEHPALQPVVHYLGQLDAAASIGLHGKANQL